MSVDIAKAQREAQELYQVPNCAELLSHCIILIGW